MKKVKSKKHKLKSNVIVDKNMIDLNIPRSEFIITTHPTQTDIDRAKKEYKLIINVLPFRQLDSLKEVISFMEGYLLGLGIEPSPYLAVYIAPQDKNIDETALILKEWYENTDPFDHNQGVTSLAQKGLVIGGSQEAGLNILIITE